MFRKSNLFAVFMLSLSTCAAAYGQQTGTVTAPATPEPMKGFQVFNGNGGSYLGVTTQEVTKENFSKFGLREVRGVGVEKVTENSPAAQAGLQNGDVIVRFEGEEVSSIAKLQRLISETAPDHQAKVTVLRDGKERDFTVTIGKHPNSFTFTSGAMTMPSMPEFSISPMPPMAAPGAFKVIPNGDNMVWSFAFGRRIGVGTSSLSKQLGDYFGVADGKGILITSVSENSPAAKAGLKAGDVIVEADGKSITNSGELMKALNSKEKGAVTLTIIRDKNRQTINVEPEENKDGNKVFQLKSSTLTPAGTITIAPSTLTPAGAITVAPTTLTPLKGTVMVTPQLAPLRVTTISGSREM